MTKPKDHHLTADKLRQLLVYDRDTGAFTFRRREGNSRSVNVFNARYAGEPAGTLAPDGYIYVTLQGKAYKGHRLAWLYEHGKHPTLFIDHINGARSDNRIINLREADYQQNCFNQRKRGKSGLPKNVCYYTPYGKFVVRVSGRDKRRHHIGYFDTLEAATIAATNAERRLQGSFARDAAK